MADLSLARYATEVELACQEIDACDGEIPEDLLERFAGAQEKLSTKVDNWIYKIDAIKSRIETLKEMRNRLAKAAKVAENLEKAFKAYIKHTIKTTPDIPYRGQSGSLYLHKNPKGVKIDFDMDDKNVYRVVDSALLGLEPSLNAYVKEIRFNVLDHEKLKADLEAGIQLSWARIEQDSHVRIKG